MSNKIEKPIKISPASMNRLLQQSNVQALIDAAIAAIPPVVIPCPYEPGDIYKTVNPAYNTAAKVAARWPGTTWESWAEGRVPVGMGSNGVTNYTTVGATGGADSVALTSAQNGQHTHTFTGSAVTSGGNSADHTHNHNDYYPTNHSHGSGSLRALGGSTDSGYWRMNCYSDSEAYTANHQLAPSAGSGNWGSWAMTKTMSTRGDTTAVQNVADQTRTTTGISANHTHSVTAAGTNANSGSGSAHENRMPYETCYMWKRLT